MHIEHSNLLNEFISFWFETKVEGIVKFETFLEFTGREWSTCSPEDTAVLLRGKWDAHLPDDKVIGYVSTFVESAIKDGRI